jgi:uncharacterized membrane protein YhdT
MMNRRMNAKHYRWVIVLLLVGAWFFDGRYAPFNLGCEEQISDGRYHLACGSAPWALWQSALFAGFYLLLIYSPPAAPGQGFFGWWRRMAAFWLDFVYSTAIVAPLVGLIYIFEEWRRTGVFAWAFERTAPAPGDGLTDAAAYALLIPATLLYFAFPLIRKRPSPGSCVMGYQIVGDSGSRISLKTALKRVVLGFTFMADRKRQIPQIDRWCGTHAVKLK